MKEELTTKMHSEFSVDKETDVKHRVWAAKENIEDGTYTKEEAIKAFGLTIENYKKYENA